MEALHRQVLPFVLRRTKEDVLADLPPKIIQDYYCELSPLQVKLTKKGGYGEMEVLSFASSGSRNLSFLIAVICRISERNCFSLIKRPLFCLTCSMPYSIDCTKIFQSLVQTAKWSRQ